MVSFIYDVLKEVEMGVKKFSPILWMIAARFWREGEGVFLTEIRVVNVGDGGGGSVGVFNFFVNNNGTVTGRCGLYFNI